MPTKAEKLSSSNLMVVLVLVSLLVVGASGLIVKSLITSITLDNKVVSGKSKADKQLTADVSAAPQLVNAYTALGSQATVIADALPTTVDFPSLVVMVDNIANDAGVQLSSITPAVAGAGGLSTLPPGAIGTPSPQAYRFSLAFTGTYDSLVKLLGDVETSARPLVVNGLQLNGSGTALTGQVDLETFYQAAGQLPFSEETVK